jgi:uncharacterized protein (DUF1778 family)
MSEKEKQTELKPFMMRLSEEDRKLFTAAAKEDGYDELSPWFRWLARARAKKVLAVK